MDVHERRCRQPVSGDDAERARQGDRHSRAAGGFPGARDYRCRGGDGAREPLLEHGAGVVIKRLVVGIVIDVTSTDGGFVGGEDSRHHLRAFDNGGSSMNARIVIAAIGPGRFEGRVRFLSEQHRLEPGVDILLAASELAVVVHDGVQRLVAVETQRVIQAAKNRML